MTTTTAPTTSRVTRLVVWLLLVAVTGVGMALTWNATETPPLLAADSLSATQDAQVIPLALDDSAGAADIPAINQRYQWNPGSDGHDDVLELLPAYRWAGENSLFSNYRQGLLSVQPYRAIGSGIGSMTFGFAAWIWQGLLVVVAWGLTTNVAAGAGNVINRGFAGMFSSLMGSGIFALILVAGLFFVIKSVLKVRIGQAVRTMLTVLLPLALLYGMAYTVGDPANTSPLKPGTPAWIADRGVNMVDTVGVSLGSGFGMMDTRSNQIPSGSEAHGVTDTCLPYTRQLYAQYHKLAGDGVDTTRFSQEIWHDPQLRRELERQMASTTSGASRKLVSTVSLLWQRAYLSNWVMAQYGSPYGYNIACHQLESDNRVGPGEQLAIAQSLDVPMPPALGAYQTRPGDSKATQAGLLAWVACSPQGGSAGRSGLTQPFPDLKIGAADGGECATWWSEGTPPNGLENDNMSQVASATVNSDEAAANREQAEAFYQLYESLNGHNSGQRMLGGIAALITSVIYLYVLGGIALGTIIAQFGLVILLILLPVTLTLLALPSERGRNRAGVKMLRMTGGFFAAKLALVVVMTLLMQSIATIEALVDTSGRGVGSFMSMLIPLACLFLVRKLIKAAGFGDITSLTGSVGLASQASVAAEGGGMMMRRYRTSQVGRLGDKQLKLGNRSFGLNSADALAKRVGQRVAKAPLKAAGNTAIGMARGASNVATAADRAWNDGKAAKAANRQAELWKERKAGLVGVRDEEGNLVEDGILQRASTFSGLVGLGAGGVQRMRGIDDEARKLGAAKRAAAREGKDPGFRETLRGMTGNADARQLQINQARNRRERRRALVKGKGQSVDEVNVRHAARMVAGGQATMEEATQRLLGEEHRPGDLDQRKRLVSKLKDDTGMKREQIIVSDNGVFIKPPDQPGRVPAGMTETATIRNASHPVNFLPTHITARQAGETTEDWTARMSVALVAKGLMDPSTGEPVDYLRLHGVDPDSEWGAEQILKASRGEDSILTDPSMTISFSSAEQADIDRACALRKLDYASGSGDTERLEVAKQLKQQVSGQIDQRRAGAVQTVAIVKEHTDGARAAAKRLGSDDPGVRQQARRELDQLADELSRSFRIDYDENGKAVGTGPGLTDLSDAKAAIAQIKGYTVMMERDADPGEQNKALKMLDIEVIRHREKINQDITRLVQDLETSEDPTQVSQTLARIFSTVSQATMELSRESVSVEQDWSKAEYVWNEETGDRRRAAEKHGERKDSSSRFGRNANNNRGGLPKAPRQAVGSGSARP